ncbi:hypothetical protein ACFYWX_10655 [Streptomyces sp. NPDC002888]|uniref:hypothetical protein n=1 Tax=Streptomyces sp. NPDC002888 TaxID=3364668 RepID=UPI0036B0FE59
MSNEAKDLRDLLSVVLEALTVPTGPDSGRRLDDRALWVRVTVKGVLEEGPEDVAWNADYLRRKLAEEEAKSAK